MTKRLTFDRDVRILWAERTQFSADVMTLAQTKARVGTNIFRLLCLFSSPKHTSTVGDNNMAVRGVNLSTVFGIRSVEVHSDPAVCPAEAESTSPLVERETGLWAGLHSKDTERRR